jgi:hypothetical protein
MIGLYEDWAPEKRLLTMPFFAHLGPTGFCFDWLVGLVGWMVVVGWLLVLGDTFRRHFSFSRLDEQYPDPCGHRMCSNRQKKKEMASAPNVCSPSFPILLAANCMSLAKSIANKVTSVDF